MGCAEIGRFTSKENRSALSHDLINCLVQPVPIIPSGRPVRTPHSISNVKALEDIKQQRNNL